MKAKHHRSLLVFVLFLLVVSLAGQGWAARRGPNNKPPRQMVLMLDNILGQKAWDGCDISKVTKMQMQAMKLYKDGEPSEGIQILQEALSMAQNLNPIDLKVKDISAKLKFFEEERYKSHLDYKKTPFGFTQPEVGRGSDNELFITDLGVHWAKPLAGAILNAKKVNGVITLNIERDVDFKRLDEIVRMLVMERNINCLIPLPPFVKLENNGNHVMRGDYDDLAEPINKDFQQSDKSKARRGQKKRVNSWVILNSQQYEKVCSYIIERYDGDGFNDMLGSPVIKYWSAGFNEPEQKPWGRGHGAKIANLVKAAYTAVKQQNPAFQVVLGGSGGHFRRSWERNGHYVDIVENLTGELKCPDLIFDYHFWSPPRSHKDQAEALHIVKDVLKKSGYEKNEVWTTEGGSWDGLQKRLHFSLTEKEHAADVVRRYVFLASQGQSKLFWTRILEFDWTPHDASIFDFTGIVHNPRNTDGKDWKKLAYYTYKLMVKKLQGVNWESIKRIHYDQNDQIYVYRFVRENNGRDVYVAWWDYWEGEKYREESTLKITLDQLGINRKVKVTEAVPKLASGKIVREEHLPFKAIFHSYTSSGEIPLGESPVFFE